MSILLVGLVEHRVPDYNDEPAVLARLAPTVPVLLGVAEFLSAYLPEYKVIERGWTTVHDHTYFAYHGPAGFSVVFGKYVAVIRGNCRHSAFATMRDLQAAYLPAFRNVAGALGGTRMALMSDQNDAIQDAAIYTGASLDECLAMAAKSWGPARRKVAVIGASMKAYNARKAPVWYLETVL